MAEKYKYTPAEIFKLRMQYKVQFNNLRKTYHQIVIQKSPHQKKHFPSRIQTTGLLPEQLRSRQKQTQQKRHYSPIYHVQGIQRSYSRGKKQFDERSCDNLRQVLKQKYQEKKKSLSRAISSKNSKSMINLSGNQKTTNGLKIGLKDKSLTNIQKSCIKIIPKYHKYDEKLLG